MVDCDCSFGCALIAGIFFFFFFLGAHCVSSPVI